MTQSLDALAVRHVAHLSRLNVTDDEVAMYAQQLSRVLEYMEQLNAVNTENVPPTAHPHSATNVLRDDVVVESLVPAEALANAPQRQDDFFRVPKVLDQETA